MLPASSHANCPKVTPEHTRVRDNILSQLGGQCALKASVGGEECGGAPTPELRPAGEGSILGAEPTKTEALPLPDEVWVALAPGSPPQQI